MEQYLCESDGTIEFKDSDYQKLIEIYHVNSIQMMTMTDSAVSIYGGVYEFLKGVLQTPERNGDFFFGEHNIVTCNENKLILLKYKKKNAPVEIIGVGIITSGGQKIHPIEGNFQYYCHFAIDTLRIFDLPIARDEYWHKIDSSEKFAHNPKVDIELLDKIVKVINQHS